MSSEKNSISSINMYNSKVFYKKLASLVFPIALQSFMLSAANASDAIMLSTISQSSLSAVSLAAQINFIYGMLIMSVVSGLGIFAAQYWGKKDIDSVEKIFSYVFKVSMGISLVFFVATMVFPEFLMLIYTNDDILIKKGALYLRTVSLTFLFNGCSQLFLCILKNSEHAVQASVISSTCVLLNIVLNAFFIYGFFGLPKLEIKGAAVATVLAKGIELLWCIFELAKKDRIKLRFKYILHSDKLLKKDYWHVSYPFFLNQLLWGIGFSMYSVIMGHLGDDAVASNSMANIIKNLVTCFSTGVASGTGIMLGNELGKDNFDLAKIYAGKLCHIALITGAAMGAVIVLLEPLILKFVSLDPTALHYLKWMLVICAFNMIGKSSNVCTNNGVFPSGGDTKFSMIMDAITMWAICVPAGFIAAFVFHAPVLVVFLIVNLDEIIKLPVIYFYFHKYNWVKNITR